MMRPFRGAWFLPWVVGLLLMHSAQANTGLERRLGEPLLIGEGRLSVLFWDVYDIKLYSVTERFEANRPFALVLHYLRVVDADDIVDASMQEMQRQSAIAPEQYAQWKKQLVALFPNIVAGDRLVGIFHPERGGEFFLNDALIGEISDLQLSRRFFDIWLGENTSRPALRQQLLGFKP